MFSKTEWVYYTTREVEELPDSLDKCVCVCVCVGLDAKISSCSERHLVKISQHIKNLGNI